MAGADLPLSHGPRWIAPEERLKQSGRADEVIE